MTYHGYATGGRGKREAWTAKWVGWIPQVVGRAEGRVRVSRERAGASGIGPSSKGGISLLGFCRSWLMVTKGAELLLEGPSEITIHWRLSGAPQVSRCDLIY